MTDVSKDESDGPRTASTFIPPEIYYARLASAYVTAGAVITDPEGRVLLVDPNYRDHWLLPGGTADENESPVAACAREVKEELGLDLPVGPLLFVGWRPAFGERPRPTVSFVFDGGTFDHPERIRLQEEELDDHRFFVPGEAVTRLGPGGGRLAAALRARETGVPEFQSRA